MPLVTSNQQPLDFLPLVLDPLHAATESKVAIFMHHYAKYGHPNLL